MTFNRKTYMKEYRDKNKDRIKIKKNDYMKEYRLENRDKINKKQNSRKKEHQQYRDKNKNEINSYRRLWYLKNKIRLQNKRSKYVENNPDKVKKWKENSSKKRSEYDKRWLDKNIDNPLVIIKIKARKIASRLPIPKNQKCYSCDNFAIERHHPDYNKPKEIIYYCRKHHRSFHSSSSVEGVKPLQMPEVN